MASVRKSKKGYILSYDLCSLPKNKTLKDVFVGNTIYFDSTYGTAPNIIHLGGKKNQRLKKLQIVDVKDNHRGG